MITSWIILLETIRVAAHVLEVLFCFPAEESPGFGRIGIVFRDVAGTAGSNDIRNSDVIDAGIGIDQIQDGIAVAGTKIDDFRAGMGSGIITGLHMALGQVNHMDIIPDAGAIRSGALSFFVISTPSALMSPASLARIPPAFPTTLFPISPRWP